MGTEFAFGGAVWSGTGLPDPVVPGSIYLNGGPLVGSYDPATGTLTLTPLPPPGPPIWSGTGLPDPVAPHNIYLNGGPLVGSYNPATDTLSLTPIAPPAPLDFSGAGIGGTVTPEEVILGTGLSGSWNPGVKELTVTLATPLGALVLSEELVTIASGAITISGNASLIRVETEGGVNPDDLQVINGGVDNQVIFVRSESNVRDVYVKSYVGSTDNIYLVTAQCQCHHNACTLALMRRLGPKWVELFRNDISAF